MKIIRAIFRTLVGIVFGIGAAIVLIPALAAFNRPDSTDASSMGMVAVVLFSAALALFAPTLRRAFGRGFLLVGVAFLALPFSTMALSGRVANDMVSAAAPHDQTLAAVGTGIAGVMMTGAAGFIGIFGGAIFIIIGLVLALGGRREVVVFDRR